MLVRRQARKRAKFWLEHADRIRVSFIAAATIAGATMVAKMALG